jgi:hypothetical protein
MEEKAIFKFNNGNLAILCSKCSKIIKAGFEFTDEEKSSCRGKSELPPQYCDKCDNGLLKKHNNT